MGQPATAETERRIAPRLDLMAQVRVKRGKVDFLMDLTNISMTGALVDMGTLRMPSWVKHGRIVEIAIIHPIDLDMINVFGKIVRIIADESSTCFAVHFMELQEEAVAGLERLHLAAATSEPAAAPPHLKSVPPPPHVRKGPPPLPPPLPKSTHSESCLAASSCRRSCAPE